MRIRHTFLCEEGSWTVRGVYCDAKMIPVQVLGEARITHQIGAFAGCEAGLWLFEERLKLLTPKSVDICFRSEILPLAANADATSWNSQDQLLGKLRGKFMFVEETILSAYHSQCGRFSGFEALMKVTDDCYRSRGYAFDETEKRASWSMDLVRLATGCPG